MKGNKTFHTAVVTFCVWLAGLLAAWNAAFVFNHLLSSRSPIIGGGASDVNGIGYVQFVTPISHGLFACVTLAVVTARSAFRLIERRDWEHVASVFLFFLLAFASLPMCVTVLLSFREEKF